MNKTEAQKVLRVISRAWGKQSGYVFFPWIDREEQELSGKRRAGYHEGPDPENPAFEWPKDRGKILDHMLEHTEHDLYWCPSVFEYPWRREDAAGDEHALWADLDEVDPNTLSEYPPTVAWESSPGRYQALWLSVNGDFQGASWPGNENQRMTYYVGADRSGWDTTQLLRIPGWVNHKPEYRKNGKSPQGKLLWQGGPLYQPGDFEDLPPVEGLVGEGLTDALESEIDGVDRHKVLARVKIKLTRRIRELISSRSADGDRSDALWEMERGLADAGCSVAEIVAIVKETVWNKYVDRADEMKRLILEASKAIAAKPEAAEESLLDDDIERAAPVRFGQLLKNVKRPKFVIDKILTEGACGFIAGEPKCYKSWFGLDMAISVSTGGNFLDHFRVINPGPVLYIQEEDPLPTLKVRTAKIWAHKGRDRLELVKSEDGLSIDWLPKDAEEAFDPKISASVQAGLVISDEAWQLWLDDILAEGLDGEPFRLIIIDTLMMVAGDVEENKSQAMTTQIFKPMKVLSRKHNVALQVVHHMGKSEKPRSGQRMLGAVANHAWSEDSLYLSRSQTGDIKMEVESKTIPNNVYRVRGLNNMGWTPEVELWTKEDSPTPSNPRDAGDDAQPRRRGKKRPPAVPRVYEAMQKLNKPVMTTDIVKELGDDLSRSQVWRQLRKLEEENKVERQPSNGRDLWVLAEG